MGDDYKWSELENQSINGYQYYENFGTTFDGNRNKLLGINFSHLELSKKIQNKYNFINDIIHERWYHVTRF